MFILSIVFSMGAFLLALTVHEFSHALVSDRLGDPTARLLNRMSLNPLRHIDWFGTIFLPGILILSGSPLVFGWAKPVPYDPFNLENPQKDSALIALAGPVSNLILAALFSILVRLGIFPYIIQVFFVQIISINVVLAVFNLIPIQPLDGFKIVAGVLPEDLAHTWEGLAKYGVLFLILLMIPIFPGGSLLSLYLEPVVELIMTVLLGKG